MASGEQEVKLGTTAAGFLWDYALARPDGKWTKRRGEATILDGHWHKVSVAGIETSSGEGVGLTITFHVIKNEVVEGDRRRGDLVRVVILNGRAEWKTIATGVEIVD
jgi:hypothetical protein